MLRSLESKIAGLVEGTFSRAFRSEVRPVEIARKLAREMEEHKAQSLSRTYAPNRYRVFLSPGDRQRFAGLEDEIVDELVGYLLEHARAEQLALPSRPELTFETDERLGLGEFGIQTSLVHDRPAAPREPPPPDGGSGRTMVYSAGQAAAEPLEEHAAPQRRRAVLIHDERRLVLGHEGVSLGRSRRCDIVLDDGNVSREHAEVRPRGANWVLRDIGSTNGSRVNGRPIEGAHTLRPGDEIELGTTRMTFELE